MKNTNLGIQKSWCSVHTPREVLLTLIVLRSASSKVSFISYRSIRLSQVFSSNSRSSLVLNQPRITQRRALAFSSRSIIVRPLNTRGNSYYISSSLYYLIIQKRSLLSLALSIRSYQYTYFALRIIVRKARVSSISVRPVQPCYNSRYYQ